MPRGQNVAGYPIGIIYIDDVWYPMLPGNVVNGYTFPFPVRLRAVEGLDVATLFGAGDAVLEPILDAVGKLEREGVRAISSACGFFGNFHRRVAERANVPVALSSMVQLPWISATLRPSQKIGVLTADDSSLGDKLYRECGVPPELEARLCVRGMQDSAEFSCVVYGRGDFDPAVAESELVEAARELVAANPGIGAILLECSDMPPHAHAVQRAVGLPVFDFTTLIRWLHSAVCQKPYGGFI
jgi:Asp/Glu/hydantoin racemase